MEMVYAKLAWFNHPCLHTVYSITCCTHMVWQDYSVSFCKQRFDIRRAKVTGCWWRWYCDLYSFRSCCSNNTTADFWCHAN